MRERSWAWWIHDRQMLLDGDWGIALGVERRRLEGSDRSCALIALVRLVLWLSMGLWRK